MSSSYTGVAANATDTLELMTGSDRKTAQGVRVPLERLLDGVVDARTRLDITDPRAIRSAVLMLRRLSEATVASADTAASIAAAQFGAGQRMLVMKAAQVFGVGDADIYTNRTDASLAAGFPITSLVRDAVYSDNGQVTFIGTGGHRNQVTTDYGATYADGGDIGATPLRLVWKGGTRLLCTLAAGSSVARSANLATTWTTNASAACRPSSGLAPLSNGNVYGLSSAAMPVAIRETVDHGANFTTVSGTVTNAASFDESGTIVGNRGSVIWHAGRRTSGTLLQVSSSPDGATWTTLATLTPPSGTSYASEPRIMCCQNTGLLVLVAPLSSSEDALYCSVDAGLSWVGPTFVEESVGVNAYAVAGGRLIATNRASILASDGIGL